jgi:hypothetical protein
MTAIQRARKPVGILGVLTAIVLAPFLIVSLAIPQVRADGPCKHGLFHWRCGRCNPPGNVEVEDGGFWFWGRSPDQEKRVVVSLYNRYCIRCHGVDGRGVWDIPDVPNFTNVRYQACRTDGELVRYIIEGRGACMPPFRGTLSLEEAWGMARYLRTFVPGTEISRPDFGNAGPQPTSVPANSPPATSTMPPVPMTAGAPRPAAR